MIRMRNNYSLEKAQLTTGETGLMPELHELVHLGPDSENHQRACSTCLRVGLHVHVHVLNTCICPYLVCYTNLHV